MFSAQFILFKRNFTLLPSCVKSSVSRLIRFLGLNVYTISLILVDIYTSTRNLMYLKKWYVCTLIKVNKKWNEQVHVMHIVLSKNLGYEPARLSPIENLSHYQITQGQKYLFGVNPYCIWTDECVNKRMKCSMKLDLSNTCYTYNT